jgi:glycosyltransferase involved in cell wall biosynthesis
MKDTNVLPIVNSCLLPYQYRNKERIINESNNNKITILLPGTIEPRKQQITFMKLFNQFIRVNPDINVELIIFGHLWYPENILNTEINKSNGKMKYLGVISNETLFDLYKTSSFSCFISTYEGYGFPISESLWHGTPVLTANFGAMNEVAQYGGCYCIDTTNESEIYEAMNKLIKEPEILMKLKKEISQASFTKWTDYVNEIYKILIE